MPASFPHELNRVNQKRAIVAGQVPPPLGGQALMIAQTLRQFSAAGLFRVEHLPFRFTPTVGTARQARVGKLFEYFRVVLKLLLLRLGGRIDCILYPIGGPQLVPVVRDVLLLPLILASTRRVILQFHAGGTAETIDALPKPVSALAKFFYRKVFAAIVMTQFGRKDPEFLGISRVVVVPHNFEDTFDDKIICRGSAIPRLLYVGHLCPDKGTPELLKALHQLITQGIAVQLDLVGECLPPYTEADLTALIARLGLNEIVKFHGVQTDNQKWRRYAEADLFVFPSIAYESFGMVMVEAMMWSLPVLACDWRGNREVLRDPPEELLFSPVPDLTKQLTDAVERVCIHRSDWKEWGARNRKLFEKYYSANLHRERLAQAFDDFMGEQ